ncbi:MAG: phenylacetate--CoA ligase family protein [Gaiellaceae bacterium]
MRYPVRRTLVFGFLRLARPVRWLALRIPHGEKLLRPGLEPVLRRTGSWRAWLAFEQARKHVPAYRAFLAEHGGGEVVLHGLRPDFSAIPITDKESYVKRWSIEERCRGGVIPPRGVVVDESSGTSGEPNNWVRGREERSDGRRLLQFGLHRTFGHGGLFVVNAFALGPWATGMNVSMSSVDVAILKSTGPDVAKIEKTLQLFGPRYRYLVCGYPPFLKTLVDSADVDWGTLECYAAVGGEGMSEALRSYLERAFRRVYSSFGASDLEINIAAENELTIALRRLLGERPDLARALDLPEHPTLPMVFQYNPLDYLVETTPGGELVITVNRVGTTAPKLRYNLHDLGCSVPFRRLREALAATGLAPSDLAPEWLDLPLLFHYGRSDSTLAFYGANVAPADVEEALLSVPELAPCAGSFALLAGEDDEANKTLTIAVELRPGSAPPADAAAVRRSLVARLAEVNQDYREAARFIPSGFEPRLEFHAAGTGPFDGYDVRLKRTYVRSA